MRFQGIDGAGLDPKRRKDVVAAGSPTRLFRCRRRSPAAVSRAIAFLEAHVGAELLHRTTRALKLSEAGERYVAACRRVLIDLEEPDIAAGGQCGPQGQRDAALLFEARRPRPRLLRPP